MTGFIWDVRKENRSLRLHVQDIQEQRVRETQGLTKEAVEAIQETRSAVEMLVESVRGQARRR